MTARAHRSRPVYTVLLAVVVALGLGSRVYRGSIPPLVGLYAGDTLWATAVVLLLAILFPQARTRSVILGAAAISLAVELSQLAHPAWLDTLRQVPGVALVIGYDFVWEDLACYAAGLLIGAAVDAVAFRGIRHAPGGRMMAVGLVGGLLFAGVVWTQLPMVGAGALLHPARRPMTAATPEGCSAERIRGEGVDLGAWRSAADCEPRAARRTTDPRAGPACSRRKGPPDATRAFAPHFQCAAGAERAAHDSRCWTQPVPDRRRLAEDRTVDRHARSPIG